MSAPHVLILSSGGVRSLVATALTLHDEPKPRVTLLHVVDGRPSRRTRRDYVRRQADALSIKRVIELDLSHLATDHKGEQPERRLMGPLSTPQILLAALGQARLVGAERVVWPVTCEGDSHAIAQATEQTLLCNQLADLESPKAPQLDAPLAEYTDKQVLELGAQLGVSWYLAWSCRKNGERGCGECIGCRRRGRAFDVAGMIDPGVSAAVVARS